MDFPHYYGSFSSYIYYNINNISSLNFYSHKNSTCQAICSDSEGNIHLLTSVLNEFNVISFSSSGEIVETPLTLEGLDFTSEKKMIAGQREILVSIGDEIFSFSRGESVSRGKGILVPAREGPVVYQSEEEIAPQQRESRQAKKILYNSQGDEICLEKNLKLSLVTRQGESLLSTPLLEGEYPRPKKVLDFCLDSRDNLVVLNPIEYSVELHFRCNVFFASPCGEYLAYLSPFLFLPSARLVAYGSEDRIYFQQDVGYPSLRVLKTNISSC